MLISILGIVFFLARFPGNALGQMQAALSFARRQMEGNYPQPQKKDEESQLASPRSHSDTEKNQARKTLGLAC